MSLCGEGFLAKEIDPDALRAVDLGSGTGTVRISLAEYDPQ